MVAELQMHGTARFQPLHFGVAGALNADVLERVSKYLPRHNNGQFVPVHALELLEFSLGVSRLVDHISVER